MAAPLGASPQPGARRVRRPACLIVCGLLAMAAACERAAAAASDPVPLQLEVIAIQLQPPRQRTIKAYFTIYIEVRDASQVGPACAKIRTYHEAAAVIAEEFKNKDNTFSMEDVEKRIIQEIKKRSSPEIVRKSYVIAKNKRFGEGSKITVLPGSTSRCQSLDRVPLDVLAHHRADDDGRLGFDPRQMLEGAYPLSLPAVGLAVPMAVDEGTPWLALTVGIAATLAVGGAAGAVYERRRRARRKAEQEDRRAGEDRRGENRGPPGGADKRNQNDRRAGADRRTGDDRRGGKGGSR